MYKFNYKRIFLSYSLSFITYIYRIFHKLCFTTISSITSKTYYTSLLFMHIGGHIKPTFFKNPHLPIIKFRLKLYYNNIYNDS